MHSGKVQKRKHEYSEDSAELATCIHCDGGEESTEEQGHLPPGEHDDYDQTRLLPRTLLGSLVLQ